MKVKDIMTVSVDSVQATDTIADAARRMADDDVGVLPILSDEKLVGIVTDRDIAVRGIAAGLLASAPIRRVMSEDVATCSPDDDISTVLALMSREQVRRMPVCNQDDQVVGMIALADMAGHDPDKKEVANTLADICEPSGLHCQAPLFA